MTNVFLEPIHSLAVYSNAEPQMIQQQLKDKIILFYDFNWSNNITQDPRNCILSSKNALDDNNTILAQNINKIGIQSVGLYTSIPNINPRNNELVIFSSVTGTFHTVFLEEGFYDNATDVMDEVINQLNSITGVTGLTFTYSLAIRGSKTYFLNAAGGEFYVTSTCTCATRGKFTYNFQVDNIPSASKTVGSMSLFYTRYVDFLSRRLTRYNKISANNNNTDYNFIFRFFLGSDNTEQIYARYNSPEITVFDNDYNDPIFEIDIRLVDEFGEILYVPDIHNYNNLIFDIGLVFE